MHLGGIYKNGIHHLICKAEIETQRTNILTPRGKGQVGWDELGLTYTHIDTLYKIDN